MPLVEPIPSPKADLPLCDQRPRTAPSRTAPSRPTVQIPVRAKPFTEVSAVFQTPVTSAQPTSSHSPIPPPPLPLVLQQHPPLRKKKSFSRVSSWLFPATHNRNISLDFITNMPKPVTAREGFYQCIDTKANAKISATTVSTRTVSVYESDLDEPTIPTSWSPDSSPGRVPHKQQSIELSRMRTFGRRHNISDTTSMSNLESEDEKTSHDFNGVVGVAF